MSADAAYIFYKLFLAASKSTKSRSQSKVELASSKSENLIKAEEYGEEAEEEWVEEDLAIETSGKPELLDNRMLPKGDLPTGKGFKGGICITPFLRYHFENPL